MRCWTRRVVVTMANRLETWDTALAAAAEATRCSCVQSDQDVDCPQHGLKAMAAKPYVREKKVENRLRALSKKHSDKCMVEKHESPGRRGVPDDLITWGHPLCIMELIETKAPKGERKKHQKRDHEVRARFGIKVHTLYTVDEVESYFATMLKLMSLT